MRHHAHHMGDFKRRFVISAIVTVPILLLSESIQAWFGFSFDPPFRDAMLFVLGTFVYFYGGWPFLSMSLAEIRDRRPGMMTLIAMAVSVAYFYSAATLFMPGAKAFFWELATLIDIMLIGHYIEAKSVLGAADALHELVKLMPSTATRVTQEGRLEEVKTAALQKGDTILVRPGEKIPADGRVEDGESSVDEALLTGESKPVSKAKGSAVYMGSTNLDGVLRVVITKAGEESYLSQVIALVEEAQKSRSKSQDLANRAAGWLFWGATGAGAVTFAAWSTLASPAEAVLRTVTVLVIACPHALGLAVPLVVAISTSLAAARGILIRNRQAFETLRSIDVVCFDKTGTITEGKLAVTEVGAVGDKEALLRLASSVERNSEHIIAKAIAAYALQRGVRPTDVTAFRNRPGLGTEATVEGKKVVVGGPKMLEREGLAVPDALKKYATSDATQVWVAVEDTVKGVVLLQDAIRPTSVEAIARLKALGIETRMLTGDNEAVAAEVARTAGIDRYDAQLMPEQKLTVIERLKEEGKTVAMVGDGINDAPALLTADIGVAIGAGTDVAIESADIILTKSDLMGLVHAIRLSRATTKKMVQNLWWASGYNIAAIPLAAGVLAPWGIVVDPAIGAVLMSVSTVVVALNAQLLRRAMPAVSGAGTRGSR